METNPSSTRPFIWQGASFDSSFEVEFPKAPDMELILIGATLHLSIEDHDLLELKFKGHLTEKDQAIVSGDPIKFDYRSQKLKSTWVGYVYKIVENNTWQGGNTTIICIGASYLLKQTDQKIFLNLTADQCVSRIAKKHGFTGITQRHPRQRESIVQAGQSDWHVCKRLARQTGFAFFADNTTLFFVSKDKIYSSKKDSAPYFRYINRENDGVVTREQRLAGTIMSFTPHISDNTPELGVRVDRVVTGVQANTGKTIKAKHKHVAPANTGKGVVVPNGTYFLQ
jgi:hypothetical protein